MKKNVINLQFKQRMLLVVMGLLAGFIFLECGLRVSGWIYDFYRQEREPQYPHDNKINILCLGDSFTFGVGVSKEFSYPEQLARMLTRKFGDNIRVINGSVPGTNSSQILNNLPKQINRYNPDIIILLTGANDSWQFEESNYYLFVKGIWRHNFYKLESLLMHLKTYKFIKIGLGNLMFQVRLNRLIAKHHLKDKYLEHKTPRVFLTKEQEAEKEKLMEEAIENVFILRNFDVAKHQLLKILQLDPMEGRAYYALAALYMGYVDTKDFDKAEAYLLKALSINPSDVQSRRMLWERILLPQKRHREAMEEIEKILVIQPTDVYTRSIFSFGLPVTDDKRLLKKLVHHNLQNIYKLVKTNDIQLVIQNYPEDCYGMGGIISGFIDHNNVPYVNNLEVFSGLTENKDYKREMFFVANDGHPNERGYGMIALNVYSVVKPIIENLIQNNDKHLNF